MKTVDRRWILRAAGLAAAAAAGACTSAARKPSATTASPSPSGSAAAVSPTPATTPATGPVWERIQAAGAPPARRDATLTADPAAGTAYLFGGRSGASKSLADLWVFDVAARTWREVKGKGPGPRFGHNAAFIGGNLVVFGGQSGPNSFLNDVWLFDPARSEWRKPSSAGTLPAARYGAGEAVVDGSLLISHGFTNSGRFDDTWSWDGRWSDVSPSSGPRPVKRCLHRCIWWEAAGAVALFGGQTNGTPFLNDFWLFDPKARAWRKIESGSLPAPRTQYGLMQAGGRLWVYGGDGPGGELGDTWSVGDASQSWTPHEFAAGAFPLPRGGVATTALRANESLMFGGRRGEQDLAELWSLRSG